MEIKPGITVFDDSDQIDCGQFRSHVEDGDLESVRVVEVPCHRLLHTRKPGGHPDGQQSVFTREIPINEHVERERLYEADRDTYIAMIMLGTSS